MYKEHVRSHAGPVVPILVIIFLFLLGASIMAALPDEMAYRWAVEGLTLVLIIGCIYLDIRYFVAEYDYRLTENELTVIRGKLGFLRDVSLTVDLEDAVFLAHQSDPELKNFPAAADNFCASLKGRFSKGMILVYKDGEKTLRRLRFEPSEKLVGLIKEGMASGSKIDEKE